jgi:hypothetical protein
MPEWHFPGPVLFSPMASNPPPRIDIDDVLPPGTRMPASGDPRQAATSELVRFLAKWLDDVLRIPGTNFKVGLDPILASIPILGDVVASGSGLMIILEAARSGVSLPVLLRMGGNMLINTVLDLIPVVGPIGSAFFKSNLRNLRLLQRWQAGQQRAIRRSTAQIFLVVGLLFFVLIGLWLTAWILVGRWIYGLVFGG